MATANKPHCAGGWCIKLYIVILAYSMITAHAAAQATDPDKVLPSDGSVHPGNARQFAEHKQEARAEAAGIGERTQRKLDAPARRAPDLLDKVKTGEPIARGLANASQAAPMPATFPKLLKSRRKTW